jgi:hypothetical protein
MSLKKERRGGLCVEKENGRRRKEGKEKGDLC